MLKQVTEWNAHEISKMLEVSEQYAKETMYPGVEFDEVQAINFFYECIHNPDTAIFVYYIDDVLAGGVIVHRKREFTTRFFGYIIKLYITPVCRGTPAARSLMQRAVDWFDQSDCIASYIAPAGMIGQDQLFINLITKYGYASGNPTYTRNRK